MNCVEFENRLRASIEEHEISCQDELREHTENCERCDALWQESTFLDQMITFWKSDLVEPDFADSVIQEIRNAPRFADERSERQLISKQRPRRRMRAGGDAATTQEHRTGMAVVVVVAAAVLLMTCDLGLFRPAADWTPHRPLGPVANHLDNENRSYKEFQSLWEETRSSYAALTHEAVQAVPDITGWLTVLRPDEQQIIERDDEPTKPWTKDVQRSLEPIGRDLGKALDFFYNTLPLDRPATS